MTIRSVDDQSALRKQSDAARLAPGGQMNTSPSLSPPGSDLDGLVERLGEILAGVIYRQKHAEAFEDCRAAIRSLLALRERVEGERDELQQTFDLTWEADMRAVKRWREAKPGNDLVLPDRADLVVWLLDQLGEYKAYAEVVNSAAACEEFDDAGDKWLAMQPIDRMIKAITSVFAKWSNDEIMGRFRLKITETMHLAFVEGALVGRQSAESRLTQLEAELKRRDEDARRMDWLERHTVNVRIPLAHGSADLFWATPDDSDEGEDGPSDLRAKIDAALQPETVDGK